MPILTDDQRKTDLEPLFDAGWHSHDTRDAILRDYKFKSFIQAFGWMTQCAIWCEKWNHHPEWSNVYNRVSVLLTTHDVNGLSELDIKLARKMDALAHQYKE